MSAVAAVRLAACKCSNMAIKQWPVTKFAEFKYRLQFIGPRESQTTQSCSERAKRKIAAKFFV